MFRENIIRPSTQLRLAKLWGNEKSLLSSRRGQVIILHRHRFAARRRTSETHHALCCSIYLQSAWNVACRGRLKWEILYGLLHCLLALCGYRHSVSGNIILADIVMNFLQFLISESIVYERCYIPRTKRVVFFSGISEIFLVWYLLLLAYLTYLLNFSSHFIQT